MLSKKLEVHPNVIFRKKIKSKWKLWKMILEIYDEYRANVYPLEDHSKRLKKFWIHPYTWDEACWSITFKNWKKILVNLWQDELEAIEFMINVIDEYKKKSKFAKNVLENVAISLLKE